MIPQHVTLHNPNDIQIYVSITLLKRLTELALYLRSVDNEGTINVQLLTAKSRVAPLKMISLPRFELCGVILLVNLLQRITRVLTCTISMLSLDGLGNCGLDSM